MVYSTHVWWFGGWFIVVLPHFGWIPSWKILKTKKQWQTWHHHTSPSMNKDQQRFSHTMNTWTQHIFLGFFMFVPWYFLSETMTRSDWWYVNITISSHVCSLHQTHVGKSLVLIPTNFGFHVLPRVTALDAQQPHLRPYSMKMDWTPGECGWQLVPTSGGTVLVLAPGRDVTPNSIAGGAPCLIGAFFKMGDPQVTMGFNSKLIQPLVT